MERIIHEVKKKSDLLNFSKQSLVYSLVKNNFKIMPQNYLIFLQTKQSDNQINKYF